MFASVAGDISLLRSLESFFRSRAINIAPLCGSAPLLTRGLLPQSPALPPDVRWRLCPTAKRELTAWGCAPMSGRSPEEITEPSAGRSETFRTSSGAAALSVLIGVSTLGTRERKCAATD